MDLSKLHHVLVVGGISLTLGGCGAAAREVIVEPAGLNNHAALTDAGYLADAGAPDAGVVEAEDAGEVDAGGVDSWVSWV